jgi:hypothetical protein
VFILTSKQQVPLQREGIKNTIATVSSSKPLVAWTSEEVQQWFLSSKYNDYAPKFLRLDGKDLAGLSEQSFERIINDTAQGIALYNAVQELKGEKGMVECVA